MNWVERKFARIGWKRLEGKMPQLKRWGPVIGTGVLVLVVALRLLGQAGLADSIDGLAGAVGITAQSPVSAAEIGAAVAALTGVVLKVRSEIRKARG